MPGHGRRSLNGKKVGCSHCGQCADEAIGGPLACIVCEREGRYALERGLADDLDLLAGRSAGGVLGSGESVAADALIFGARRDRMQGKDDETLKCGPSYGMEEKRGPEPKFTR